MSKKRLDVSIVEAGLLDSREKAQALIIAGGVLVNEVPATKAGTFVSPDDVIRIRGEVSQFVGRGGDKLFGAIKDFKVEVEGKVCLDIGSSTGGFTDCLLQQGAKKVFALDVGTNQLAYALRIDPRVEVYEQTHVKDLSQLKLRELPELVTIDVSFISVTKTIPHLKNAFPSGYSILVLIKPQFELAPSEIAKGGIPKSQEHVERMLLSMKDFVQEQGFEITGLTPSRLKGKKSANQEYFLYASI